MVNYRHPGRQVYDDLESDSHDTDDAQATNEFLHATVDSFYQEHAAASTTALDGATNGSANTSAKQSNGVLTLDTGGTSSSEALLRKKVSRAAYFTDFSWDNNWTFKLSVEIRDGGDNRLDYWQVGDSDPEFNNGPGFGFKLVDVSGTMTLQGFAQTGGSETTVDLETSPGTGEKVLRAEYTAGTDVEFFVDGTSQGTVSSGLPSGNWADPESLWALFSRNTSGVQRRTDVGQIRTEMEAP